MRLIYAMLLGFILDLIFGDPHGLIHPVQIIGWFIDKLKMSLNRSEEPDESDLPHIKFHKQRQMFLLQ